MFTAQLHDVNYRVSITGCQLLLATITCCWGLNDAKCHIPGGNQWELLRSARGTHALQSEIQVPPDTSTGIFGRLCDFTVIYIYEARARRHSSG